jgi:DNA-binding MarR family transcriptional regulator
MVVQQNRAVKPSALDIGYLGLFLGLRVNELVRARMRAAGYRGVRDSHGFVIQHLIESDRSITELAGRMNVTQQAASKMVAELVALGMLESTPGEDRRAKRIRLSARGWRAVRLGRRVRLRIERRLTATIGVRRYRSAQRALVTCLDALGGVGRIRARRIRMPS